MLLRNNKIYYLKLMRKGIIICINLFVGVYYFMVIESFITILLFTLIICFHRILYENFNLMVLIQYILFIVF